jgi:hypothetical protein
VSKLVVDYDVDEPYVLGPAGEHVSLLHPEDSPLLITTIARSLCRIPRYTSHTLGLFTYSVGQHSLGVSYLVPREFALEALLHDGSEAYLNDLSSPLKSLCPDYKVIEKRFDIAIRVRFQLPLEESECVRYADRVMLATEKRDLMPHDHTEWGLLKGIKAVEKRIRPDWFWPITYRRFMRRFEELTK